MCCSLRNLQNSWKFCTCPLCRTWSRLLNPGTRSHTVVSFCSPVVFSGCNLICCDRSFAVIKILVSQFFEKVLKNCELFPNSKYFLVRSNYKTKKFIYDSRTKFKFSLMTPSMNSKNWYVISSWNVRMHAKKVYNISMKPKRSYMVLIWSQWGYMRSILVRNVQNLN